jgi:hypothetical protein
MESAEKVMACRYCAASGNVSDFNAEICLHFPGFAGLSKPAVIVFPRVVVCLHCGFAEFTVPESQRQIIAEGTPVESSSGETADES